ncbi:MAG: DUF1553 domain-containing protein [Planctomycetes bacterium]|nr:DUF1553 domain-containing protein [Planctomycetota bacterium]
MPAPSPLLAALALFAGAAECQQHWAFVPPVQPPVPEAGGAWAANEIDRFVAAARDAQGLAPNAPATRGELLRRVTFDLTGLPPTLAELDAFERDQRPDAYERVVDRLLASPAHAEENTRLWLDLSRYADTSGMQRDQVRALWRWRDWVLDAYAADVPFDRFVTEQLAGDRLPGATDAQRIASGWNRNNPTSDEGGLIPDEYLARYAMNRTDTFGTAMLGLTVGCAQCHDHKSDPLTQRDYYRLLGYFASFAEDGNDGGALAAAPNLRAPRPDEAAEWQRRRAAADAAAAALAAVVWAPLALVPTAGADFVRRADGASLARGDVPARADYEFSFTNDVPGARTVRLVALPDESLPARGPGRAGNGNFVLGEIELYAATDGPDARVPIASADAEFAQPGFPAAHAIDGNPSTGWALNGRHEATALHLVLAAPLPTGPCRLVLRQQTQHHQHVLGCFAVHATVASATDPLAAHSTALQALRDYEAQLPVSMVSGDLPTPRAVHVLARGRYDQPGERMQPGTPAILPPLPADAPADRRALAAWLFAPGHPLTARVAVNRIWLRHFGRGLVATPHDFGVRGARPSHPELLDWLACEFAANGWDERRLHRLLVLSATYRQSACTDASRRERDPDNAWLARMARVRLPAEAIRDQALATAGLLLHRTGGPSVRIQQPPGIWEAIALPGSNTEHYVADTGDDLRRRSLYTFWKRTAGPPLLLTFDAPSRETCVVERQCTTTPLQTLAVWNDEGMVAATRAFGEVLAADGGDVVDVAFRRLLQRHATDPERRACDALLAAAGVDRTAALALLASTLLSLDEAMHRN